MRRLVLARVLAIGCLAWTGAGALHAQTGHEPGAAPIPPPLPPEPPPEEDDANDPYQPVGPDSDAPWLVDRDLVARLADRCARYAEYVRRFTTDETARSAEYDRAGEVSDERIRRYGYLLRDIGGRGLYEIRQELGKDGTLKPGEVADPEPFPPAYAWVYLFSKINQPYFSYRYLGDRFDGFDWIHEIQFKGSLPFTDGKDIRQWEGTILVDAVSYTPLEIRAEPLGQHDRIEELYRRYNSSFNIMGMRTAPKPLGYRAQIQFRFRESRSQLAFPTELRYDTFRAISTTRIAPVSASIRTYSDYRIFSAETEQQVRADESR
jgi:hypothetical protein